MNNKKYIEWDVKTWEKSLLFWEDICRKREQNMSYGLDIGSRHGGLSLFFAQKFGSKLVCSDYGYPSEEAKILHKDYSVSNQIEYADVDCTNIPYLDNTFDFVVFKSVLGAVGRAYNDEGVEKSLSEMYRVLKPGGILLFAENLEGMILHKMARRIFVEWGQTWKYMSVPKMKNVLSGFKTHRLKSTGFLSVFVPNRFETIKNITATIDGLIFNQLPITWKYVSYGYAIK
jgi:ubiquinone/menaquinone biosynthesis C-methylase UbiE